MSGSTVAWFVYVPGVAGANTVTVMFRGRCCPAGIVFSEPLKSPPVQVIDAAGRRTVVDAEERGRRRTTSGVSAAEMNRAPVGRKSFTTTLLTGSVPRFATVRS